MVKAFATAARRLLNKDGSYRRDHLRGVAQLIEVGKSGIRIMGTKTELLRTLAAAASAGTATSGIPSFEPKWRTAVDNIKNHFVSVALAG